MLSTSKPMVAGTSVRLPSISDSSATTNKWVWKLSPLGLRAACQLNIAKRSAVAHPYAEDHNSRTNAGLLTITAVKGPKCVKKSPSKSIKYVFFLSTGQR
ncbi:hypothetical protein A5N83_23140 [Rhodococcus sp. 1139]|nr:hypothetical protein A5N83_23140 [Rhodococcus sp. 1139]